MQSMVIAYFFGLYKMYCLPSSLRSGNIPCVCSPRTYAIHYKTLWLLHHIFRLSVIQSYHNYAIKELLQRQMQRNNVLHHGSWV